MNKITGAYKSPKKNHSFDFIFNGEIRFGPEYYKLKLNGKVIPNKIFGFEFKWHPNSKYLALQEWLTTDYKEGPITILTLIDLDHRKFTSISKAKKGFVKPLKFEDNHLFFETEYLDIGKKTKHQICLDEIGNWKNE